VVLTFTHRFAFAGHVAGHAAGQAGEGISHELSGETRIRPGRTAHDHQEPLLSETPSDRISVASIAGPVR